MEFFFEFRRMYLVISITIVILVATASAHAQKGSPCQCEDIPDLLNLLNMDDAVLDGLYEYEQKVVKPTDLFNEILSGPNPNRLTKGSQLLNVIKQQMDWVRNKAARTGSGEIDTVSCKPKKIEAGSDCLKHILELRTNTNAEYCRNYKLTKRLGEKEDVIDFMSVKDYLLWQRELNERETTQILYILSGIDPVCRPKDWIGMITVYEDISNHFTLKTEESNDTTIRSGVIRYNGKTLEPLGSWQVGGKYTHTKFALEGKRDCTGGLDGPKPDTTYKTSFTMEVNKNGGDVVKANVSLGDPDTEKEVLIGLEIPTLIAKWDFNSVSKRESGCPNDSLKDTNLYTTDFPLNSERLNFMAKFFATGNPKKGEPVEVIVATGPVQDSSSSSGGAIMKHTHWVGVHLYKLRK